MARTTKRIEVDRLIGRGFDDLDAAAARSILRVQFTPAEQDRIHELSALTKTGKLSPEQRSELDGYLKLGSLLTIMHSKARQVLKRAPLKTRRKTA